MNIFLMGYMGCGKTTIGKGLAEVLDYSLIDFDAYIEEEEGATISEIFKERGEIYFRKRETHYLKKLLAANLKNTVVALGGGTPCYGVNLELIQSFHSLSIYLNTSVKELTHRLWAEREKRPLIYRQESKENLEEFIRKHLFERGFYYNQSQRVVKTDSKKTTQIVEEIVTLLF